jgi:hypothetical protein
MPDLAYALSAKIVVTEAGESYDAQIISSIERRPGKIRKDTGQRNVEENPRYDH